MSQQNSTSGILEDGVYTLENVDNPGYYCGHTGPADRGDEARNVMIDQDPVKWKVRRVGENVYTFENVDNAGYFLGHTGPADRGEKARNVIIDPDPVRWNIVGKDGSYILENVGNDGYFLNHKGPADRGKEARNVLIDTDQARWNIRRDGAAKFPLKVEQHTELGNHHRMRTAVLLSKNRQLDVYTRSWTANKWEGFTGKVAVALYDDDGNWLWSNGGQDYGVNAAGPFRNENTRDDQFGEKVPKDVFDEAFKVAILHSLTGTSLNELLEDLVAVNKKASDTAKKIWKEWQWARE